MYLFQNIDSERGGPGLDPKFNSDLKLMITTTNIHFNKKIRNNIAYQWYQCFDKGR